VTRLDLEALLVDSRYALRQCREYRDPARAADALERMEDRLDRLLAEAEADAITDDEPSALELEEMHALCDSYRDYSEDDVPF
jgi:phage shock protein A